MAKAPQTTETPAAPQETAPATADTAQITAAPAPARDAPASGLRLATALCRIQRNGRVSLPGDPVPVDRDGFAELRAFDAVPAAAWEDLPAAAE